MQFSQEKEQKVKYESRLKRTSEKNRISISG